MDMYHKMKTEADDVRDNAEQYVRLQAERLKLELIERISLSITDMVFLMVIGFFIFGGMFLLCVAVGFIVQQFTDNFIIAAGAAIGSFGIMAFLAVRYSRGYIRDVITKAIVNSVYEREE